MPSFKLIKPYGQRYKDAENSLQHHTTQAHKSHLKPTKTSSLERQDRSCNNRVADHQRETPGEQLLVIENNHPPPPLPREGPYPLALDRRAPNRRQMEMFPLEQEECSSRGHQRTVTRPSRCDEHTGAAKLQLGPPWEGKARERPQSSKEQRAENGRSLATCRHEHLADNHPIGTLHHYAAAPKMAPPRR
jgi:hypothetical protein